MHNAKYIHEFLRPFFPDQLQLKHIYGLGETRELSRLHLELLRVIARNENVDLLEAASLMNIGHVSAAEMVDTLLESGLLKKKGKQGLGVRVSPKVKQIREFGENGFLSLKQIVGRERKAEIGYSMYPDHLRPRKI